MTNIVKNNSKGYGYNYASLADLVLHLEKAGKSMPKMRINVEYDPNGKRYEFLEYQGKDGWERGATIVIPDGKGMNAAQLYASGITYAKRVTLQLAEGLATTDDELVEDIDDKGERKTAQTSGKAPKRKKAEEAITPELETQMADVAEMRKAMFAELATPEQKNNIQILYTKAEIMKMLGRLNKSLEQLTFEEAQKMIDARSTK